jgi:restriction endonuclease S subunit
MSDVTTLGDVLLDIQAGKSFQTAEVQPRPDALGVLKVSAVTWTNFRPDEAKALVGEYAPSESHRVKKGDLLISRANTKEFVGAVVHVDRDHPYRLLSDKTLRLVVDEDRVCKSFLLLALRSSKARKHIEHFATGTSDSMRNIAQGVITSIPVTLPKLEEQRIIASQLKAQLAEADKARQAAQTQLADIALLRARTLQAIFSELHEAPRKTLGEHATTMSGATPSRSNKAYWQPAKIPWVKTGEVAFAPITATEEAISTQALAECSLALLPPQTVLIAMYGQGKTRGQSAILQVAATTNQACFAILPNGTWEPEFLQHWLMASYQDLRDLSEDRGGNQANLNGALLKALQAPAPDKAMQQDITQRAKAALSAIDAMEQACQASLKDIDQLPQRILAQAFGEATP